ncbi:MAG: helix-turn-helix transcriptional regulator, partial [Pseudomonadota bacterium]
MEQPFKQLHSLRKSRKLKQEDVAKMAGISREAYLRAESGRADPRLSTLMAVAGA